MNLSYAKLRKTLSVILKNKTLRKKLEDLIAGKDQELSEMSFLDALDESNVDGEILEILTGKKTDELDAAQAIGVFCDFFIYIKASWQKLKPLLSSIGLKLEVETPKV